MTHNNTKKRDYNLKNFSEEQLDDIAKRILNNLEEGMSIKEATGVTDETLEEIYSLAYGYYNQGKYKEAVALFQFLSGASPTTYKYLLGLGASYHQMEVYEEAILGFYFALSIEPENPVPAYYVLDSFLKLELYKEAEEFAELTLEMCGNDPEYQELKKRCELIKKTIKQKLKG